MAKLLPARTHTGSECTAHRSANFSRLFSRRCFMSVVLQSLLHNPLLRSYFLSDAHNRHRCPRRLRGLNANASSAGASTVCLACSLDDLFSSCYSCSSTSHLPLVPSSFLFSLWTHADHLSGYAMHDAHEMLMATLDGVHDGTREMEAHNAAANAANGITLDLTQPRTPTPAAAAPSPAPSPTHSPCPCIVHRVFGGQLRSDAVSYTHLTLPTT